MPLSPEAHDTWTFRVLDILVDGKPQHVGSFDALTDSGTSLLAADQGLKDWFENRLKPANCAAVNSLPVIALQISENVSLPMFPPDYIDQVGGVCELALMPTSLRDHHHERLILGDSFLRRYVTIFDRRHRRLGFGVSADSELQREMSQAMFPDLKPKQRPLTQRQHHTIQQESIVSSKTSKTHGFVNRSGFASIQISNSDKAVLGRFPPIVLSLTRVTASPI